MHYVIDTAFLKKDLRLWDKRGLNIIFEKFQEFSNQEVAESQDRCFVRYLLELEQANRLFLRRVKELPMIMKCRTKGDDTSRFGGQECAEFMKAIRDASDKYLNESEYADASIENTIGDFATKIRNKARSDEKYAWDFEKTTKQEYLTWGKDNTLEIFKKAAYDLSAL